MEQRRSSDLKNLQISITDVVKGMIVVAPCIATICSAVWYFSAWSEKVNNRLDDIDKDLKSIHLRLEHEPRPALESYVLRH